MGQLFDRIKTPFRKRKPPMLMQRGFFYAEKYLLHGHT